MDATTQLQLTGLFFTVLLPAATVVAVGIFGRRFGTADTRPMLTGIALLAGLVVAWVGIDSLPSPDSARGWSLITAILAGVLGLALDRIKPGKLFAVGLVAAPVLALGIWQSVAPMKAVWLKGIILPLASETWVLDAGLIGLVTWLGLDHASRKAAPPAVLAPLAFACAGAAAVAGLSHSGLIGQLFGGLGLAIGVTGLMGWRWPDLRPGHGAIAAGFTAFAVLLVYAHIATDTPRPASTLILLAPLAALAGIGRGAFTGTVLTVGLAMVPIGVAVWSTQAKIAAEDGPAEEGEDSGPDYGNMGGY